MRALVQTGYGGIEKLELREVAKPEPKAGELRVRILACGVNGSDIESLTARPFYARLSRPIWFGTRILGTDIVGVVDAIGPNVQTFEIGQRVVAETLGVTGGLAEYAVAPQKAWVPVPDDLSDETAASLPHPASLILGALGDLDLAGQKLLVNGGGGSCGPMAIQYAKSKGAFVYAVDTGKKQQIMQDAGADEVFDYEVFDYAKNLAGLDTIFDVFGTRSARQIAPILADKGRYWMAGGEMSALFSVMLFGGRYKKQNKQIKLLVAPMGATHIPEALRLAQRDNLKPIISRVAGFESISEAIGDLKEGKLGGKLIFKPGL